MVLPGQVDHLALVAGVVLGRAKANGLPVATSATRTIRIEPGCRTAMAIALSTSAPVFEQSKRGRLRSRPLFRLAARSTERERLLCRDSIAEACNRDEIVIAHGVQLGAVDRNRLENLRLRRPATQFFSTGSWIAEPGRQYAHYNVWGSAQQDRFIEN